MHVHMILIHQWEQKGMVLHYILIWCLMLYIVHVYKALNTKSLQTTMTVIELNADPGPCMA